MCNGKRQCTQCQVAKSYPDFEWTPHSNQHSPHNAIACIWVGVCCS